MVDHNSTILNYLGDFHRASMKHSFDIHPYFRSKIPFYDYLEEFIIHLDCGLFYILAFIFIFMTHYASHIHRSSYFKKNPSRKVNSRNPLPMSGVKSRKAPKRKVQKQSFFHAQDSNSETSDVIFEIDSDADANEINAIIDRDYGDESEDVDTDFEEYFYREDVGSMFFNLDLMSRFVNDDENKLTCKQLTENRKTLLFTLGFGYQLMSQIGSIYYFGIHYAWILFIYYAVNLRQFNLDMIGPYSFLLDAYIKYVMPNPDDLTYYQKMIKLGFAIYYYGYSMRKALASRASYVTERIAVVSLRQVSSNFVETLTQNHHILLYISSMLYFANEEVKMTKTRMANFALNAYAYSGLTPKEVVQKFTFAQSEEDEFEAIFSGILMQDSYIKQELLAQSWMSDFISADRVVDIAQKRIGAIMTFIRKMYIKTVLGREVNAYDFDVLYPGLDAYHYNLIEFNALKIEDIQSNRKIYEYATTLLRDYGVLMKKSLYKTTERTFHETFREIKSEYQTLHKKMSQIKPKYNEPRQQPVGICLEGPSQIGKTSFIVKELITYLLKDQHRNYNYEEDNYVLTPGSKYWDNFGSHHLSVVHDEEGAFRAPTVVTAPDEAPFSSVLQEIQTTAYIPPQASIEDKGTKYRAKVTVYCTNKMSDLRQYVESEAILNRLYLIQVSVKPDYMIGKTGHKVLDIERLNKELIEHKRKFEEDGNEMAFYERKFAHLIFTAQESRFKTQQIPKGVISTRDLLLALSREYKQCFKQHRYTVSQLPTSKLSIGVDVSEFLASIKEYNIEEKEFDSKRILEQGTDELERLTNTYNERYVNPKSIASFAMIFVSLGLVYCAYKMYSESSECLFPNCNEEEALRCGCSKCSTKLELGCLTQSKDEYSANGKRLFKNRKPRAQGANQSVTLENDGRSYEVPISELDIDFYGDEQSTQEFRISLLYKNVLLLYNDKGHMCMQALGIEDQIALIPTHFLTGRTSFGVSKVFGNVEKIDSFIVLGQVNDLSKVQLNKLSFRFRSITSLLPFEKDISDVPVSNPSLIVVDKCKGESLVAFNILSRANMSRQGVTYHTKDGRDISITRCVSYDLKTRAGMCGSVLTCSDGKLKNKVISLHVAGLNSRGYGSIMSREAYDGLTGPIMAQGLDIDDFCVGDARPMTSSLKSCVHKSYLSKAASLCHFRYTELPAPTRSKIVDGVMVHPLESKLNKWRILPPKDFDSQVVEFVYNDMKEKPLDKTMYTIEEATLGCDDLAPMVRDTSLGYTWSTRIAERSQKSYYLPVRHGNAISFPSGFKELNREVNIRLEAFSKSEQDMTFYVFPKADETRAIDKVLKNQARAVFGGDFIDLVCFRMHFGSLLSDIKKHRIDNEIAVGVNPLGYDWMRLMNKLNSFPQGDYTDTDVEAMEYTMYYPLVVTQVIRVIMSRYKYASEDEKRTKGNMLRSVFKSTIVFEGKRYSGMDFNPSGHPLTAHFNCYNLKWWKRFAYYSLLKEAGEDCFSYDYSKHVSLIVMGDDSVENIDPDFSEIYNCLTFADFMKRYDITVTPPDKWSGFVRKKSLSECTFLKRKFLMHDGLPSPELDDYSLINTIFWAKCKPGVLSTQSTIDSLSIEFALKGEEAYDELVEIIDLTNKIRGLDFTIDSYEFAYQHRLEKYIK